MKLPGAVFESNYKFHKPTGSRPAWRSEATPPGAALSPSDKIFNFFPEP